MDITINVNEPGLVVARLQSSDHASVEALCVACRAFFDLVKADPDPSRIASELLEAMPPDVQSSRKHVLGIKRDDHLVGMVDLIEGFPNDNEWYVGILLLLPEERNRGTGKALWAAVETVVRSRGGKIIRLIVQEQNPLAASFWESLGFVVEGQVTQRRGERTNTCWKYRKDVSARAG